MINGYVTFNELELITGLDAKLLKNLLLLGMNNNVLDVDMQEVNNCYKKPLREQIFNLQQVQDWICLHIY